MNSNNLQNNNLPQKIDIDYFSRYIQERMITNINKIIEEYYSFQQKISGFLENNKQLFNEMLDNVKEFRKFSQLNNKFERELFIKDIKMVYLDFNNQLNNILEKSLFIKKIRELNKDIDELLEYEIIPNKNENNNKQKELLEIDTEHVKVEPFEEDLSTIDSLNPYNVSINGLVNNESYNNLEQSSLNSNSNAVKENNNNNAIQLGLKNGDNNENDKNTNDNCIICSECNANKAVNICSHCNRYYCQGCSDFVLEYESMTNHILKEIPQDLINRESLKDNFLQNFMSIIKPYIKKCNYILNSKSIIRYPQIDDINNIESQKKFLNDINLIKQTNDNINDDDDDNDNYNNNEIINVNLMRALECIFTNKKLHLSDNINEIDDDFFSDEKLNLIETKFEKIKNQLFYFITVVSKDGSNLDMRMDDVIINKIYNTLSIDKNNIFVLFNDKIDNFVKTKNFFNLDYTYLEIKNQICKKLIELKLLSDEYLCNLCKIPKNYLDYRGNTLNPNSSNNLIRGTEKYDPPYGWIGIGLNVLGKYDNGNDEWLTNNSKSSEWAIAYHGISSKNRQNIIMNLLKNIIIKKNLSKAISKIHSNSNDKRNWGKVRDGIYLTPNIRIAERYTGIISFNNKRYKVLLMARVYIKKIREPENTYFWVLDDEDIRIYRILFKEIS